MLSIYIYFHSWALVTNFVKTFSCLPSPFSCHLSSFSCLPSPVSCLPSSVSHLLSVSRLNFQLAVPNYAINLHWFSQLGTRDKFCENTTMSWGQKLLLFMMLLIVRILSWCLCREIILCNSRKQVNKLRTKIILPPRNTSTWPPAGGVRGQWVRGWCATHTQLVWPSAVGQEWGPIGEGFSWPTPLPYPSPYPHTCTWTPAPELGGQWVWGGTDPLPPLPSPQSQPGSLTVSRRAGKMPKEGGARKSASHVA